MTPEPINCYRCGKPGYTDWLDIRTFGDAGAVYVSGEQYCLTPGCTDPDGSRRLTEPTAEELRAKADKAWLARQRALVEEW